MKMMRLLLIAALMAALAGCALADGWTCPGCGRINSNDMNFCGNCRTEKPKTVYTGSSDMINAWVCSSCGRVCPAQDNFCTKCGADRHDSDAKAILIDKPVYQEVRMPSVEVRRIPCTLSGESVAVGYTALAGGVHRFWVENQSSDLSAKMLLYDKDNRQIRANDFYGNDPGFSYRLSKGEAYSIVIKGSSGQGFTLCIGEPRDPVRVNARSCIMDSMDYYDQTNTYLFVPDADGEYRVDIEEIHQGQEITIGIQDQLGYTLAGASYGMTMGSGIAAELEAGKQYEIAVAQRTVWGGVDLGQYRLRLNSPNPPVSVNGCDAVGDHLCYQGQRNVYEYTAPETGSYTLRLGATDAGCDFGISVFDGYGYNVARSSYSAGCSVDLTAGKRYQIVVEQRSGAGSYTLFIQK